jgi:hypothetical protein
MLGYVAAMIRGDCDCQDLIKCAFDEGEIVRAKRESGQLAKQRNVFV